jgi:hypothetical protein
MVKNLVLALAGALVFAGLASAGPSVAGKFTLPFEARWGLATLPAGDYQFTMESVGAPATIEVFRGAKPVALIFANALSTVSSGQAELTIVRTREGNTVRDLSMPDVGIALHYAPHRLRRGSAAAEREVAQVVSVAIEGK